MGTDMSVIAPFSVSDFVNGKGQYNCSLVTEETPCTTNAGYSKFLFERGKTYRLRLINAGAEGIQKFSIDDHVLAVVAVDFVPIVPRCTGFDNCSVPD
jgi:FtsP/CotA-like multicopper oxidase with cupredoxin domain